MPFKYSKLTDESPSFFLLRSLEFSKIFLYYDNINSPSTAGVQVRTVWKKNKIKFGIVRFFYYLCINKQGKIWKRKSEK